VELKSSQISDSLLRHSENHIDIPKCTKKNICIFIFTPNKEFED